MLKNSKQSLMFTLAYCNAPIKISFVFNIRTTLFGAYACKKNYAWASVVEFINDTKNKYCPVLIVVNFE